MMYEGALQQEVGQNVNVGCGVEAGVREDAFYSKVGVSVGSGVEGVLDGRRLGAWVGGDAVGSKLVGGKDVDGASDGWSVCVKVGFEVGCSVWFRLVNRSTIESCELSLIAIPVTTPTPKATSTRIIIHHINLRPLPVSCTIESVDITSSVPTTLDPSISPVIDIRLGMLSSNPGGTRLFSVSSRYCPATSLDM
jgi:hypothetical protein